MKSVRTERTAVADEAARFHMLNLTGVTKRYFSASEEILACDHIDLQVAPSTLVCLSGVSGVGKSTLLRLCAGIEVPDEGTVVVGGVAISDCDERERAAIRLARIGIIFQENMLFDEFTVLENVSFIAEVGGVPGDVAREGALSSLGACGIADLGHRYPSQISGGQRQRVAVARGWCGERPLLLADEPTASLDSANAIQVFRVLRSLSDRGAAVLVATHDSRCRDFADFTFEMIDGQLKLAGG